MKKIVRRISKGAYVVLPTAVIVLGAMVSFPIASYYFGESGVKFALGFWGVIILLVVSYTVGKDEEGK